MKNIHLHRNLYLFLFFILGCALPEEGSAQIITTIAGNGTAGYAGDGSAATAAAINWPRGVAFDNTGNIYIADVNNNRIRKVSPAGIITTIAGNGTGGFSGDGGPATAAQIYTNASGSLLGNIAVDGIGNKYIADWGNCCIRKVDTFGTITTFMGIGTWCGYSTGDGGPATAARMLGAIAVATDGAGNVYFTDYASYRVRKVNTSGIVSTYGGNGTSGSSGDGGPATTATVGQIRFMASDASGNLFLSDYYNYRVRKINSSGVITTVAGNGTSGFSGDGGPATAAHINPTGVVVDGAGNLYISDYDNQRIRKVNTSGIISTIAGNGTSGFSGDGGAPTAAELNYPLGLTMDGSGNLYVGDANNSRVRKITFVDRAPYFTGGASQSISVCQNSVSNPVNSALAVIDSDAGQTETWALLSGPAHGTASVSFTTTSTGGTLTPTGLTYTPTTGYSGNDTFNVTVSDGALSDTIAIYVTVNALPSAITGTTTTIVGYTTTLSDATSGGTWSSSNTSVATVGSTGVVTGVSGGVVTITYTVGTCFVTALVTISCPGMQIIITIAGGGSSLGDGGPATAGQLTLPTTVFIDPSGNKFIADYGASRIRKVSPTGIITTIAGTGSAGYSGDGGAATAAQINQPAGVCTDAAGNVYIAEQVGHRIRKINTSGIITTIAGSATSGFSGDGGPSTAANVNSCTNVITDASGNVYFADYGNGRVRKINTSGIISTVAGGGSTLGDGGPATAAQLNIPYGISLDGLGNLFIGDEYHYRVRIVNLSSGVINTFAGTGTAGFSGDGGAATAALLNAVDGVYADADNVYISDPLNNRIRKVNRSTGIITTIAGMGTGSFSGDGGPATAATLHTPSGMMPDNAGNLYIADFNNARIRKVIFNNYAPYFTGGITQNLSVCQNSGSNSINSLFAVIDSDAGQTETWSLLSGPVHGTASVSYTTTSTGGTLTPTGLTYSPSTGYAGYDTFRVTVNDGCLLDTIAVFVTVNTSPAITGFTSVHTGSTTTLTGTPSGGTWSSGSTAIATVGSSSGIVSGVTTGSTTISYTTSGGCIGTVSLLVGSLSSCPPVITTFAGNGTAGFTGDGGAATSAEMNLPDGVAVDAAGNVFVADYTNNRIRKINTSGIISTVAGNGTLGFSGDGGAATSAMLNTPTGVAVDGSGNLYIADGNNNRIRKVNTSGVITTVAGSASSTFSGDGGPATAAGLNGTYGLAVDGAGNIFLGDYNHQRVRRVNTSGIINTVAGTGSAGFSGDGGAAISAMIYNPYAVAVDGSGNLYIADRNNNRIRLVNSSGIINTIAGGSSSGYSGDGGAATAALLNNPVGVAVDNYGYIYISDWNNNVVRVVSSSGTINTFAGNHTSGFSGDGGPATSAKLNAPAGVCVDTAGNVYIGDWNNQRIRIVSNYNHRPHFTGGHSQSMSVCANTVGDSINSLLAVLDTDAWQSESWSVVTGPVHGSLTASYSATSTGTTITPHGLFYTPTSGYSGNDSFKVAVVDCAGGGDTTVVHVAVNPLPSVITGTLSVCVGSVITLTDATGGGLWSSGSIAIATIGSSSGILTGISAGNATITYTLSTGCISIATATVNTMPAPITGVAVTCIGSTTTLYDAGGGTWTSSSTGVATIGSLSGIVTGVSPGSTLITYSTGIGCNATFSVTVAPLPTVISGITGICVGGVTALSDGTPGGYWTSGSPGVASVGSGSGILTGLSAGSAAITYAIAPGILCAAVTIVSVNPFPGPISGATSVCVGQATSLTDAGGGRWVSSAPGIAAIGSSSGIVTGMSAGIATITYILASGCSVTAVITVNPLPVSITGSSHLCIGTTATLTDSTAGGYWTSSSSTTADIDISTGVVTGVSAGTATITYTLTTGCFVVRSLSVDTSPGVITGTPVVCIGSNTILSDATGGGVWTSGTPGVATAGSLTGVVTGVTSGITTITYSAGAGCLVTTLVTVNSLPTPILGFGTVCIGATVTLIDGSTGGAWSSGSPAIATAGSLSGIVTGITSGIATISYTLPTGCFATKSITVNSSPGVITGVIFVCSGGSTVLTTATGGGVWSSSLPSIATIGSGTGLVTGISAGISSITYSIGSGCVTTVQLTVNPLPSPISGLSTVCAGGATITLTDATAGGTWTAAGSSATIGSTTGIVTGVFAGTSIITYSLSTGCSVTRVITIYPLPAGISGPPALCAGASITLTDASGGGTWLSATPAVATIGSSTGIITGVSTGIAAITYTLPTGCRTITTETVSTTPSPITGPTTVCAGSSVTLGDVVAGGLWSSSTSVATIGSLSGVVSGVSAGTTTITYSLGTGCTVTRPLTVNPAPAIITGATNLCAGTSITLSDVTTGGYWSSPGSAGIFSVGSSTGVVSGIAPGTAIVTYALITGCAATASITVNPAPAAITGPATVCAGAAVTELDGVTGGAWNSTSPGIATIGSSSGIVTGITGGSLTITYAIGSCAATRTITVNSVAPVTGISGICVGATTALADATPGGTWTSGTISVVTVGSSSGTVTGISAGTAIITYTLSSGCYATLTVTVNSGPAPIGGLLRVCVNGTTILTDAGSGGTWTSSAPSTATIGSSSGLLAGVLSGTVTVTYSLGTGCTVTTYVTVNPLPGAISGPSSVCVGQTGAESDGTVSGIWSSSNTTIATIGSSSGILSGMSAGIATISYTLPTGCAATRTETINPGPATITGTARVCVGATSTLIDVTTGGLWNCSPTTIATVGTGTGIVTGVMAGIATITYTITESGCIATLPVTVNSLPGPITGAGMLCIGATSTLSDALPGGVWSSGATGIATVGSSSGIVTGVSAGTAVITYSSSAGCTVTKMVTVSSLPPGIAGTSTVCIGTSAILSDAVTGGIWTSSNTMIATIGSVTGIVTGVNTGSATITYSLGAGCFSTKVISVNAAPPSITGSNHVCAGAAITLSDFSTGGTWSSGLPGIATIGSLSGIVTGVSGGSATISYTVPMGCIVTYNVTVNSVPVITGLTTLCAWGDTLTVYDADHTGSYSSTVATVLNLGGGAGRITTFAPGTSTVTYTLPSGCTATESFIVNPLPGLITGSTNVCAGAATTLHNTTAGGVWSSAAPAVATVGSGSGIVSGVSSGATYISYILPTGCKVDTLVHVNPPPPMIIGYPTMVAGTTTPYSDGTTGGLWGSSNTALATIGISTGIANGISAGVVTFTYTIGTGCFATKNVTVNPLTGVSPEGVEETVITNGDIIVLPNPNKGEFILRINEDAISPTEESWFGITDMLGRLVYQDKITSQKGLIEERILLGDKIANGMYLMSVHCRMGIKVLHIEVSR